MEVRRVRFRYGGKVEGEEELIMVVEEVGAMGRAIRIKQSRKKNRRKDGNESNQKK